MGNIYTLTFQIAQVRNKNRISVVGKAVPAPLMFFEDLIERYKVKPTLVKNIARAGYQDPTPVQMQTIPLMLEVTLLLIFRLNTMHLFEGLALLFLFGKKTIFFPACLLEAKVRMIC